MHHDQNILTILMFLLLKHLLKHPAVKDQNVAYKKHPKKAMALGLAQKDGKCPSVFLAFLPPSLIHNVMEVEEMGRTFQTYFSLLLASKHANKSINI